ncbi:MAG: HAD-IA family hydrolase [Raoultibacter sp.]
MQPRAKAILFDLDGTVLDTHDLLLECFQITTQEVLGRVIDDAVLMAKVGQPLNTQMWDFTDDAAQHEALCRVYRNHNEKIHDQRVKVFPGVVETLQMLGQAGYPLGVVTSKRHAPALHGLELFDLARYFDCLVGSDDIEAHKPDPAPVRYGAQLLGHASEECIYVGDSPFDMQAGNGAGCFTVAALWGMFPEAVLQAETPNAVCSCFADVVGAVEH